MLVQHRLEDNKNKNTNGVIMSAISRYEVRLKCVELAVSISSEQDPLDLVLEQADKIYVWVNKVEKNGNRSRSGTGYHKGRRDHQPRNNRGRYYENDDAVPHTELFD
jgi:hypothetical protein